MENVTYWFSPKLIGWGFMPITVEGWIATIIFLALILLSAYSNDLFVKRDKKDFAFLRSKQMARFVLDLVLLIALFTLLFADKVEGGLQWRFF